MRPLNFFTLLALVVAVAILLAGCERAISDAGQPTSPETLALGAQVYGDNCASCHGADGKGTPGTDPPMVGSLLMAGDPVRLIRVMTQGTASVAPAPQRSKWTNVMPVDYHLNDEQIAALITYMRHDFGSGAGPVNAGDVARVRAQFGGFPPHAE